MKYLKNGIIKSHKEEEEKKMGNKQLKSVLINFGFVF